MKKISFIIVLLAAGCITKLSLNRKLFVLNDPPLPAKVLFIVKTNLDVPVVQISPTAFNITLTNSYFERIGTNYLATNSCLGYYVTNQFGGYLTNPWITLNAYGGFGTPAIQLYWQTTTTNCYFVQVSTNFKDWAEIPVKIRGDGTVQSFYRDWVDAPYRFWRLRIE